MTFEVPDLYRSISFVSCYRDRKENRTYRVLDALLHARPNCRRLRKDAACSLSVARHLTDLMLDWIDLALHSLAHVGRDTWKSNFHWCVGDSSCLDRGTLHELRETVI